MTDTRRAVFVSQLFPPEKGGNASRIHDTVRHLGEKGWEPIVLSPPPCYPPGEFDRSWQRSTKDAVGDITVYRLWTWQPQQTDPGMVNRLCYYLIFGIHAMIWLLLYRRQYDIVVTSTPPISTGGPGLLASLLGKPWIVDVRDLWIDASISLGYLDAGTPIERVSRQFQHRVLHTADRITVTTDGIGDSLRETYGESLGEKTVVIPNGVDIDRFQQEPRSRTDPSGTRDLEAITDSGSTAQRSDQMVGFSQTDETPDRPRPLVIYTGNLGAAQDLESCLRAIPHLSHEVCFRLVGSGDRESQLKQLAADLGVADRVEFTGVVSREAIPGLLNEATIGLAPIEPSDELAYAMPTKLYEYMACGLPAVVTGTGEIERFVDDSGGGVHADNDPEQIAEQIDALLADEQTRHQLAEQGCQYVTDRYDREAIATRLSDVFVQLVDGEEL